MRNLKPLFLILALVAGLALQGRDARAQALETAIFAGGCFWCVEADFDKVPGVVETVSGYTGGSVGSPTYKQVSKGGTGHYEAVRVRYDPARVSYRELVDIFWRTVDPTDADGQFCDRGESYRTAVFVRGKAQEAAATASLDEAQAALGRRIVTPILPASRFWQAEARHQDYYKGRARVLTRFGVIRQSDAYKRYREACGRDKRVRQLWGDAAPFAKPGS